MPAFSNELSKIKMRVLTANGQENFNWYSFIDQNKKSSSEIITGMKRRLSDKIAQGKVLVKIQVVQFYEHGNLIETYKL